MPQLRSCWSWGGLQGSWNFYYPWIPLWYDTCTLRKHNNCGIVNLSHCPSFCICSRSMWIILQLRYVCVIQFVSHLLQLIPIRHRQQNFCCMSKCMMKHQQKPYWKSDLPWFSIRYRKNMFANSQLCLSKLIPMSCGTKKMDNLSLFWPK